LLKVSRGCAVTGASAGYGSGRPAAPVTLSLDSRSSIIVSIPPEANSALSAAWMACGSVRLAGDNHGPKQKLLPTTTSLARYRRASARNVAPDMSGRSPSSRSAAVNAAKVIAEVVTPGAYSSRQTRIRPSTSAERAVCTVRFATQGRVSPVSKCGVRAIFSAARHLAGDLPNWFHQALGDAKTRVIGAIRAARSSPAARTSSRSRSFTGPASP
jgi:hypothetical protein